MIGSHCCWFVALVLTQAAPATPARLLEMHGVDASQLNRLVDGQPLGGADEETLIRILDRTPRFPKEKLEAWGDENAVKLEALADAPDEHRTRVMRLRGRATAVQRIELLPEVAARLDFPSYYRVSLQLSDGWTGLVCTRTIPAAWPRDGSIDQPAGATGIFLKTAEEVEGRPRLVFVADRVAWFPEQVQPALGITSGHVYLAEQGFDVGLLDQARAQNNKPLSLADRECFYALLAAVKRADEDPFEQLATQRIDVIEVLKSPEQQHGKLMTLRGVARRAIKVRVDDPDVQARFGLDHYYQIDLFVELDKQVIKFSKEGAEDAPVFENSFPVTVCTLALPPNLPEGELLRENVLVHAAFFKLWTYSSDYVQSFDQRMQQVSPMMIGTAPELIEVTSFNPGFGMALAILVVVSLVGLWWGVRRHGPRPTHLPHDQGPPPDFSQIKPKDS